MERDPVCGMTVDPSSARASVEHDGKTLLFLLAGLCGKIPCDTGEVSSG